MTKKKKCKGCGEPLEFVLRNGIKTRLQKNGFGLNCGCAFNEAYKNIDNNLKKNVKDYEKSKIAKRSKKRIAQEKIYSQLRKAFLNKKENKICPITNERTTEIHHKKGRIGDLLIDTRYWIALSRTGHIFIEQNPEWAKENGYSLSRLENDKD